MLNERGENLERSLLQFDLVAVAPQFTTSKVNLEVSDT
jgi:hypothetical protein